MNLENISFDLTEPISFSGEKEPENYTSNGFFPSEKDDSMDSGFLSDSNHGMYPSMDDWASTAEMDGGKDNVDEGQGGLKENQNEENDVQSEIDDHDPLDISWLNEHESINNIESMYCREPMKTIHGYFLYMNKENALEKILTEPIELEEFPEEEGGVSPHRTMGLSKNTIEYLTQSKRNSHGKYKLSNLLLYCVSLEPEQLQTFAVSDIEEMHRSGGMQVVGTETVTFAKTEGGEVSPFSFLREIPLFTERIVVSPSIFIFHELNSIYFLFREAEVGLKSILKTGGKFGNGKKSRVRKIVSPARRMTRKVVFAG